MSTYPTPDYRSRETLADIAYMAGAHRYHSGDSREDISRFIAWAEEFEARHKDVDWNTNGHDYMTAIEQFTAEKLGTAPRET